MTIQQRLNEVRAVNSNFHKFANLQIICTFATKIGFKTTMKTRFTMAVIAAATLIACQNTPQEIAVPDDALANTEMAEAQREKTNEGNPFEQGGALGTALPTTAPAGATLNPPHGQPGHRCDIAVGAPLPNDSNVIAQAQAVPVGQGEAYP